jgi:alpha-L-fucosidase
MLVDIVSKNGNLLINVVQRPDGSLDPEAEQVLAEMARWIAINGEGIYETRPWLVHGEGPVRARGGHFREDFAYTEKDVRFTRKGENTLYAFAMGWPTDGKLLIRSLSKFAGVTARIDAVSLLGCADPLKWSHEAEGLAVQLPDQKPCDYAVALKITGEGLLGFKPELAAPAVNPILPDATGSFRLSADDAELHGAQIKVEEKQGKSSIGYWDNASESASWKVNFKEAGKYKITASLAVIAGDAMAVLEVGGRSAEIKPAATGSWDTFAELEAGAIEVAQAGEQTVKLKARDAQSWKPINVRWIKLSRIGPRLSTAE